MKILMLLVLVSCANTYTPRPVEKIVTSYYIDVDAISAPNLLPQKYVLKPGTKVSELRFQAQARIVKKALAVDGFVEDVKAPDVVVYLTSEVSDPKTQMVQDTYDTYGSTTTQLDNSFGQRVGSAQSFGKTGQFTTNTEVTKYMRKVSLKAVSSKTGKEVWEVDIKSLGRSGNLMELFPYMMSAAIGNFGKTTAPKTSYEIYEDDPKAIALTTP